ncbi:MAG: hypothetical protein ACYCX2_03050 [Christensenellales bacterium]
MKKRIALLLVLIFLVSILSSCGNADELKAAQDEAKAAQTELASVKTELTTAKSKAEQLEKDLAAAQVYDAAKFPAWLEEEGTWKSIALDGATPGTTTAFKTDAASAPTDDQLKALLHFASLAVSSGGKTDWFLVAVKDPAEQTAIIGKSEAGNPKCTSAGTITILVFSERVLRPEFRTDAALETTVAFQPDRGYYDAGIITGYLNVGAIAMGYGSHMFQTPTLPGINGFNEGGPGLDCAKYLEGTKYINGSTKQEFSNENMKFVCAVVIGTLDEKHTAGTTERLRPDNWIIWDK